MTAPEYNQIKEIFKPVKLVNLMAKPFRWTYKGIPLVA